MNDPNVEKARASKRCSACKLPEEALAALHQDRFENGLGFEALAQKYALPDRPLSESGCRRHFSRHVPEPEDSPISEGDDVLGAHAASSGTDELDGHAVLEASTRALTEMMDSLVREHRAAVGRNPREAERLLTALMKVQAALAKSLKERDEGRARQEQFRKTVPQIVDRCISEAARSIASLMRENTKFLRQDLEEMANGRLNPEDFWRRLARYENAWPIEVATRMKAARTEALKAAEAKVQE